MLDGELIAGSSIDHEWQRIQAFPSSPRLEDGIFLRGDANRDSRLDVSDPVFLLIRLFVTGEKFPCQDAADADDGGQIEITDAISILGFLFLRGASPQSPFPDPGADQTADALDCWSTP